MIILTLLLCALFTSALGCILLSLFYTVFVNEKGDFCCRQFLSNLHQFKKSLCPSSRFQNIPNRLSLAKLWQFKENQIMIMITKILMRLNITLFKIQVNLKTLFFGSAIPWLKIILTLQV